MVTSVLKPPRVRTLADLVRQLGDLPLSRIRLEPAPGTATDADLVQNNDLLRDNRCELIDRVLVEKAPMSHLEDAFVSALAYFVNEYLRQHRIGKSFTSGAIYRMSRGNCRLPDFSVCLRDKFPGGRVERVPIAEFAPDLAVEILSRTNTPQEIELKRQELFDSGTRLIWVLDPARRTVEVFNAPDQCRTLTENDVLDGGDVLPGFQLSIRAWFREAEEV